MLIDRLPQKGNPASRLVCVCEWKAREIVCKKGLSCVKISHILFSCHGRGKLRPVLPVNLATNANKLITLPISVFNLRIMTRLGDPSVISFFVQFYQAQYQTSTCTLKLSTLKFDSMRFSPNDDVARWTTKELQRSLNVFSGCESTLRSSALLLFRPASIGCESTREFPNFLLPFFRCLSFLPVA